MKEVCIGGGLHLVEVTCVGSLAGVCDRDACP